MNKTRTKSRWRADIFATQRDLKLRAAAQNWIDSPVAGFDVAICLHVPSSLRQDEKGWDDLWLEKKLRFFFKRLDWKLFRSAYRRRKQKIRRFVVLENRPSVGWHVHALLSSQDTGVSVENLCDMIKLLWLEELGSYIHHWSAPRLVWAERNDGNYGAYITKSLSACCHNENAKIDLGNTHLG
jgi:hypothetical protein